MKTQLDLSQRALASKFVRAMLLIVGVLIAFQAIGFDLTLLSVFGGALGVGIGLGLQKLASNYIAGLRDPARPLDPSRRPGHRGQSPRRRHRGHLPLCRGEEPRRRRGHRPERDAGHDHRPQPFVQQSRRPGRRQHHGQLRDRRRPGAGADVRGRAPPSARADRGRPRAGRVRRCALPTWASSSSSASGSGIRKTARRTCEATSSATIWKAFQQAGIGVPVKLQEVRVFAGNAPQPAGASDASPSTPA